MAFITAGVCDTAITRLNRTIARIGRAKVRTTQLIGRGETTRRRSHAGMPSSRSGGATSDKRRCWVMCTDRWERSARSCTGQSDAIHMIATPVVNVTTWRRVTGPPPRRIAHR